jgi:hypothetical protein
VSNGFFTITSGTSISGTSISGTTTPSITVTAPNGGETWQRGTSKVVSWSYTGDPGPYVKVVLTKAGVEVGTATYSTSIGSGGKGSYTWPIWSGRAPGSDYRVSIQSTSQATIKDISNLNFKIY